jgi:AbrB family looped-hinge helix DNA binding protein
MSEIIKVSPNGQVDLPEAVRIRFGLRQGDRMAVTIENDRIVLQPLDVRESQGWRQWRGALENTDALAAHLEEHAVEVANDRLS